MAVERNVDGLRNSAEKKRQKSFEKFELGIQKLLRNKDRINFKSVAEASGLSRAWLYKESEVKARIEQLRKQTEKTKKVPLQQKASDSSKDALIKTLKVRLKKVEAENQGLKRQLEVVYGQMSYGKELEQKIKRLKDENKKLKDRLYVPVSNYAPEKKVVEIKSSRISQRIIDELNRLEVKPTSTLVNKIMGASEETVLIAIEALKEQMDLEIVKRPGAWLSEAIANNWQPNKAIGGAKPKDIFAEWFELAKEYGIVRSCRQEEEKWLVQDVIGNWLDFEVISSKYSLEYLKSKVNK